MRMIRLQGVFVPVLIPYGHGPGKRTKAHQLIDAGIHILGTTKEGIYVLVPHEAEAHAMSASGKLTHLGINNTQVSGTVLTDPLIPAAGGTVTDAFRTLFGKIENHPLTPDVTTGHRSSIAARLDHTTAH